MWNAGSRVVMTAMVGFAVIILPVNAARAAAELDCSQMPKSDEGYTEKFGLDLHKRGLYPEALFVWKRAFETHQDAGAAYELGIAYLDANIVAQDIPKALKYLRASALRGDMRAQFELGTVYDNEETIQMDRELAAVWYFLVSMRDDPGAEFNLGSLYETGEGGETDPVLAYAYYSLAASHGLEEPGQLALARVGAKMTAAEREQAIAVAEKIQASRSMSFAQDKQPRSGSK